MAVTAERTSFRVPSETAFDGADFLEDDELQALLLDVVEAYDRLSSVIAEHEIDVVAVWKRRGGTSGGVSVFGSCVKTGGLLRHFAERPFVIWLAADHIEAAQWSVEQVRRELYHRARFIGWQAPNDADEDGEGHAIKVRPELQVFVDEVSDTGAWESFRRRVGAEFRQPTLFGVEREP